MQQKRVDNLHVASLDEIAQWKMCFTYLTDGGGCFALELESARLRKRRRDDAVTDETVIPKPS